MSAARESGAGIGAAPAQSHQPNLAPLCEQIATLAGVLIELLDTSVAAEMDEIPGAYALAGQIGMLADAALRQMGAPVVRGDAMDWLSWPNVREALTGEA